MNITKKQKFIYTIWLALVIFNCLLYALIGNSCFYVWDFSSVINYTLVISYPWLIAALTSKDRKAWTRFLLILAFEMVLRSILLYLHTGDVMDSFWDFTIVIGGIYRLVLLFYIVMAFMVRKDVVVKSVQAKCNGGKVTSSGNSDVKKQNQWVKNQKKKQEQKSRLDFEPVEQEVVTTNYNRTLKMDLEQAPIVSEAVKQEAVKGDFVKEEVVTTDFVKTENVPNNAVTGESKEIKEKLDINLCSEDDFLSLPGMSLLSAKRAVELRETQGDYKSIDDFVARNAIKPHFMVRMESMIMVTEKQVKNVETPRRGRMLDL